MIIRRKLGFGWGASWFSLFLIACQWKRSRPLKCYDFLILIFACPTHSCHGQSWCIQGLSSSSPALSITVRSIPIQRRSHYTISPLICFFLLIFITSPFIIGPFPVCPAPSFSHTLPPSNGRGCWSSSVGETMWNEQRFYQLLLPPSRFHGGGGIFCVILGFFVY